MTITLFGVVWGCLLFYTVYKKNVESMVFLTLFSMIFQCNNVFVIPSTGVGPQIITSFVFIIFSFLLPYGHVLKIGAKSIQYITPWILLLGVIFVSSIINSSLSKNIFRIIQICIYVICFIRMFSISRNYKINLDKITRFIIWFVVIIGVFQYLMSAGILPKFWIVKQLLFNEQNNPVVFFYNSNVKRVFSTFMEASYCAPVLVGGFYYILYDKFNNNYKKYDNILMLLLLVEIFLTFSATAYAIFIAIGAFTSLLLPNNKKRTLIFKVVFFTICLLGVLLLYDKLIFMVESKLLSGSGVARNGWNIVALRTFNANKIIGVGYKNSRASSLILTILSEMGIIGLGIYLFAIITMVKNVLKAKECKVATKKYLILIMSTLLAQFISCPDLDFCVFWLFNYFISIEYGSTLLKKNKISRIVRE